MNRTAFTFGRLLFCLLLSILLITCKKNEFQKPGLPYVPIDLTVKVHASVSGFVTNETGQPLIGVAVNFGDMATQSDKFGYFEISGALVEAQAAKLLIQVPGYFRCIRTFEVREGQSVFTRASLMPKPDPVDFSASSGGHYPLPQGGTVSVPANGVVLASNGTAYTGTVRLAARWIDPLDDRLWEKMPGDLRGILADGNSAGLETYGMIAVEMTGTAGEALQPAPGKKTQVRFPIPAPKLSGAPASMPLWYFDEQKGLWTEEGSAVKNGSYYEGEVAHFSFWNCDYPQANVQFSLRLTDQQGTPLFGLRVKLTAVDDSSVSRSDYTNGNGEVTGLILGGRDFRIDVFENDCRIYSMDLPQAEGARHLGNIALPGGRRYLFSGNLVNCSGQPVTNGKLYVNNGRANYIYPVTNGHFSVPIFSVCSDSVRFTIVAIDEANRTQGFSQYYTIGADKDAGTLQACGDNLDEYSNVYINGEEYMQGPYVNGTFTSMAGFDGVRTSFSPTLVKKINGVFVRNNDHIQWTVSHSQLPPSTNSTHEIFNFAFYHGADLGYTVREYKVIRSSDISLLFFEYGPPQVGFIKGSLTGKLYRVINSGLVDTLNPVNISYQFRNKRVN